MNSPVIYVSPHHTVDECMALMTEKRIRHLPVVEEDQLVGLVSIRDVMQAVLESKGSGVSGIEDYIMGSGFEG